jgi:hypothetical protein
MTGYEGPDYKLSFGWVLAFSSYEEAADPWSDDQYAQPKIGSGPYPGFTWPFQRVENSTWLASFSDGRRAAAEGSFDTEFTHYAIVTLARSLHIITHRPVGIKPVSPSKED